MDARGDRSSNSFCAEALQRTPRRQMGNNFDDRMDKEATQHHYPQPLSSYGI